MRFPRSVFLAGAVLLGGVGLLFAQSGTESRWQNSIMLVHTLVEVSPSAKIVQQGAASYAVSSAVDEGRAVVMTYQAGASTHTLPAATGSGAVYRFVVGAVNTNNHVIQVTGTDVMGGNIITNSTVADPDLAQPWPTAADSDTVTLNGTTSGGGAKGDFVEVTDIATGTWAINGVTTSSGVVVTPFSAAVP